MTYQDRTAGLYLAGADSSGFPMALSVAKTREGFRLWHEFTPVADARGSDEAAASGGGRWESPYRVAVGVTQGAWWDSADQYKRWAVQQTWCAKTLAQRDDIPAWWKAGPDVHVVCVRTYDSQRVCNGSYYPRLRDHLLEYRRKIDGPVVAMLAGWENHRRWTAGDYFPVFDHESARTIIPQLKQDGFRPFLFLSGLFYTYENEGRDGSSIPAAEKFLPHYVIDEATGRPRRFTLDESNPSGDWKRHSYEFCVSPTATTDFFRSVVDQVHALGVDVLQMDQTVRGAGDPCCSTQHGHSPGPGLYQSHDFWKLLDQMRRRGKELSPDFVLFHEEPHEQLIPHLDGFHVRDYYEKSWYRGYPGAVGVPLFSYLYHEYAIGYGGDSAGLSKFNSRWLVRAHAMNLIAGRTPGGAVWSSQQSMFDAHPDQIAMLRNHCRLLKTPAGRFLMLGKMLHPYELDAPKLAIDTPAGRGARADQIATPAILTSSWQAPAGHVGHLFVNIAEAEQPLRVMLDTRNAPAVSPCEVVLRRFGAAESAEPLWRGARLPREFSVRMAPLEAVFLEIREAESPGEG